MPLNPIPIVTSIEPMAVRFRFWLVDIWGVIHNGVAPFAPACDACARFRLGGGLVLLLSNAPRPAASVAAQLDRIGVPRFTYDAIVSSGDAARAQIAALGPSDVYHLGPERDLAIYDGLAAKLTPNSAEAGAVVCTGLFDDEVETPDDYAGQLKDFAAQNLPMICANPDLTVERGGKLIYCAGAIAAAYEKLGGAVQYAGKPFAPIYDMALAAVANMKSAAVERDDVLAIGDGISTDIKGAASAGIASIYVASSVSMPAGEELSEAVLARLFPDAMRPVAAMPALAW